MKAKSWPKVFPVAKLSEFDFGDSDAFNDTLLFDAFCYTNFVKTAQNKKRTLLIGVKGLGKSALFKAFIENRLPPQPNIKNNIIIGISDELRYLDTDKIIKRQFSIYGYSEESRYGLLWEFYIRESQKRGQVNYAYSVLHNSPVPGWLSNKP